jgi:hypothetical protein
MDPPYPKHREPGWFERSSWADRDWTAALNAYWDARGRLGFPFRPNAEAPVGSFERTCAAVQANLSDAREDYRRRILSWYRKLCLPLGPGCEVPNRVAELMFEQWDLDGCDATDAVNL